MSEEKAALGISCVIPDDITTDQVWKALLIKIKEPNLFLPVTDVFCRASDDGFGTYREMSLGNNRIAENIYDDEGIHEVKFVVTDDENEHVNIIHVNETTGERTLEFYKRHSTTKDRVFWDVPRKIGEGGIAKTLEFARTL